MTEKRNLIIAGIISLILSVILLVSVQNFLDILNARNSSANDTSSTVSVIHISSNTDEDKKENSTVNTDTGTDTDTDTDTDTERIGLKAADCNPSFWEVKLGIAECYDHVFKQGHMTDTAYYSGTCEEHDTAEIEKLAQEVKLYRDQDLEYGTYVYLAILPESGWSVCIYDSELQAIIDAQIDGEEENSTDDDISIVFYYYENSIAIEMADKE